MAKAAEWEVIEKVKIAGIGCMILDLSHLRRRQLRAISGEPALH